MYMYLWLKCPLATDFIEVAPFNKDTQEEVRLFLKFIYLKLQSSA